MAKVCSIEGCLKPVRTRGWCNMHYHRWRQHGDPNVVLKVMTDGTRPCSVKGCSEHVKGRGLCDTHYHRWRTYGDAERPPESDHYTYLAPGVTVEMVRNVSCPRCGAWSTYLCFWPNRDNASLLKRDPRLHPERIEKFNALHVEGRV